MEEIKEDELAKFHKRRRKRHKTYLTILLITLLAFAIILLVFYSALNKKHYINYNENSKIEYGVSLLENDFYKTDYLDGNVDIIASLIKNIDVKFKYNLNLSEDIDYAYDYKIIANIELKEKNKTNVIYTDSQEAISKDVVEGKSRRIDIVENVNIDYISYNDQINKLIEQYQLNNTESQISLTMKLNLINKATGERINKETNAMTIVIPLNTKTVEITINENSKVEQGKIIIQENNHYSSKNYLVLGIILLLFGIVVFISLIRYISKTRSAEKMYEDELKKILFDYRSYIQQIHTKIDYKSYKIIKINSFNELIGMREELQAPILMYIEENNLKTIFMMIKDDLLFTYILSAKSIRTKLIENSKKKTEKK